MHQIQPSTRILPYTSNYIPLPTLTPLAVFQFLPLAPSMPIIWLVVSMEIFMSKQCSLVPLFPTLTLMTRLSCTGRASEWSRLLSAWMQKPPPTLKHFSQMLKKSPSNTFLPALTVQIAQSAAFALGKTILFPRLPPRLQSFPCPTGTS